MLNDILVETAKRTASQDLQGLDAGASLAFGLKDAKSPQEAAESQLAEEAFLGYSEDGIMAAHATALAYGIENDPQTPIAER